MTKVPAYMLPAMALLLFTGPVSADTAGHCDAQARELAMTAGEEILPNMTADQRAQLRQLALEVCARYASAAATEADAGDGASEGEDGDWFTDYILEGKPADKPGNRRLKRLGR